jgi:hypothetical protein
LEKKNNNVNNQNELNDGNSMIYTAITIQQHYIILYMNTEESVGKQLKQYNSVTITKVVRSDDICENQLGQRLVYI